MNEHPSAQPVPADRLPQRAARGVALAALAVAFVVAGPITPIAQAFERTHAVAVYEQRERRRTRDRVRARLRMSRGPRQRRPMPARP